jgi:hypothetical protein
VREYFAYGLPLITGHVDTDFPNAEEFILQLPNTKDNIRQNVDRIRQFVNRMVGYRVPIDEVRERIDSRVKEKKRMEFISKISTKLKNYEE